MNKSVWTATGTPLHFNELQGNIKTDVLIVGGGICGILCAYLLQQQGIDYVLAEGNEICSGITKNTTAKITSQHGLIYYKLIKTYGREKALQYLQINEMAILRFKNICSEISCELEEAPAFTYSLSDREKIENEVKAVKALGYDALFVENTELPFDIAAAIKRPNQAQFNPLEFVYKIAGDLNIYENTFIRDITPHKAISDNGEISAKKIIVTTHFPFINKHGSYFLKLYQHRSYVIALENAEIIKGMYVDEDRKGMSFKSFNNLLFVGGGSHRTGKQGGNWQELRDFAKKYYPKSKEKYAWATQDCMSLDGIPYIGRYSAATPDLYVASGFNKWGMTSSMVAAMIFCDLITTGESEYQSIFSPSRNMLKPQLFVNGIEATGNLLRPSLKRCPHLGCALTWNKNEHTWDCPCHGSRFEKDGKLIDNPATGKANV